MTKASEGSQRPATSRKPITLPGSVMPETMSPMPNTRPAAKADERVHMRCLVTKTVAMPAAMNAPVATSERGDRRDSPHTPWPLVQPAP